MIRFSLTRLQQQAPYELILSGDSFMFQTDLGIHYSISFMKEDISFAGCDTYQFIIRKIEEKKSQHDTKVEMTILAIINEFFRSNTEIMLYMCDTSDGREEIRNRLFLSWFQKHADKKRFTICKAHATVEEQRIFFVIVIENRNPKLHEITTDFRKKADLLTQDKPSD